MGQIAHAGNRPRVASSYRATHRHRLLHAICSWSARQYVANRQRITTTNLPAQAVHASMRRTGIPVGGRCAMRVNTTASAEQATAAAERPATLDRWKFHARRRALACAERSGAHRGAGMRGCARSVAERTRAEGKRGKEGRRRR